MSGRKGQFATADLIARECLAVRLRALNRSITAVYDEALRGHGLRVGQLNILVAVARMRVAQPAALCRVLRMEKSTLSRDVEIMKRNGWLQVDDNAGGRRRPLKVTQAGLALLDATLPAWQEAQRKARALLGTVTASVVAQISLEQPPQPAEPG